MTPLNNTDLKRRRSTYIFILLARAAFFSFFVYALDRFIELGTAPSLISLAAILGLLAGTFLSSTRLALRGFLTISIIAIPLFSLIIALIRLIPSSTTFGVYSFTQHLNLIALSFWIATLSTYFFWRYKHALTVELFALIILFIGMLAGHRHYHFDRLEFVNSVAWYFGVSQLTMLIIIIAAITISIVLYSIIAATPFSTSSAARTSTFVHNGAKDRLSGSIILTLAAVVLYLICYQTYTYHEQASASKIKNGVGEDTREGISPLDFHSGLGSSNQPVALVRLDNDYKENPNTPMLYFRDSAISDFDGKSLIIGDHKIDDDVNFTTPQQPYNRKAKTELEYRTPVVQSVYLLAEQQNAFAIDYPLNITPLKVPDNTNKFKAAYKAYSMAPAFLPKDLSFAIFDNPDWTPEVREYYLRTNPDPRYKELAEKITANGDTPLAKLNLLIAYLNQNVIYTLTPGQEIKDGEDPVSTFLFGDMRGYCVHFAHAITYLLRSLGFPTRIATGYATDLSQAKDGHILLRMNDRHAWAEVYVNKIGWIPFDLAPQHVESHAETPVDVDLLEELMGLIGPDEEILPEDLTTGEKGFSESSTYPLPSLKNTILLLATLLLLLYLYKAYLILAWHLPSSLPKRLRRGYRAVTVQLHDLGFGRQYGETYEEFRERVSSLLNSSQLSTASLLSRLEFDRDATWLKEGALLRGIEADNGALHVIPLKKRLLSYLNISSILTIFERRRA